MLLRLEAILSQSSAIITRCVFVYQKLEIQDKLSAPLTTAVCSSVKRFYSVSHDAINSFPTLQTIV